MRYNIFLLILFIIANCTIASAQLQIRKNFQEAYESETRSIDGAPGKNYWQNTADYEIEVSIDPATRILTGTETITYTNNSPNDLQRIVIRLYQDIRKKGNARDYSLSPKDITDGVKITRLVVAGEELNLENPAEDALLVGGMKVPRIIRRGTNMNIFQKKKIEAGKEITIEIDWSFIIPANTKLRMGAYGEASMFIAYWYPQIAVYDDIDGWDRINYKGTVEMYNDFNDYEVTIRVPDSLLVWATGKLQNAASILSEEHLSRYERAWMSDEVVRIVTAADHAQDNFLQPTESGFHSWKYSAQATPDFAFAISDSFLWDGCSVEVEPGRRVLTDAAYRPDGEFYDQAASIARAVIQDLSTELPGVPYPFPSMTVFNGSGGMEFPMIVNDGPVGSELSMISLTYHEIAHSYFPFYMGINERKYAWMDEGWAQFLPTDFTIKEMPDKGHPLAPVAMTYGAYSGRESELPLMTPSYMTGPGYGNHAYSKPALAYSILRDMLGEEKFKKTLQFYIDQWHGKHPTPYDFFYAFNKASGKNLDWFWQKWFFETATPDLQLADVKVKKTTLEANINNVGGLPVPIHVTITFEDRSSEELHIDASVWAKSDSYRLTKKFKKPIKMVAVGGQTIPEGNRKDNKWKAKKK